MDESTGGMDESAPDSCASAATCTDSTAITTAPIAGSASNDQGPLTGDEGQHPLSPLSDKQPCDYEPNQSSPGEPGSEDDDGDEPTYLALLPSQVDPLVDLVSRVDGSEDENPYDNDDLFEPEFLERVRQKYRLKRLRKKLEKQSTLDSSAEEIRPRARQVVSPERQNTVPCLTLDGQTNCNESDLDFLMKNRTAGPLPDYMTERNPKDPLPRIKDQPSSNRRVLTKASTLMALPFVSSASESDPSTDYEEIEDYLPPHQSARTASRERLGTSPAKLIQVLGLSPDMRSRTKGMPHLARQRKKKRCSKSPKKNALVSSSSERVSHSRLDKEPRHNGNNHDAMRALNQRPPKKQEDVSAAADASYLQKLQTFEELLEVYGTVKTHLQAQTPGQTDTSNMKKSSAESSLDRPTLRRSPVFGRSLKLSSSHTNARLVRTPSPSPQIYSTHVINTEDTKGNCTLPRHMQKLVPQRSTDGMVTDEVKKRHLKRIRSVLLSSK